MKYLALAVLLTVVQTVPPVPRQATNNQTSQSSKDHHKSNNSEGDTQPPSVNAKNAPPKSNGQSTPATPSDADGTINITESPAVPVRKSGWDIAYVVLTGCLVVVGIFGVCYARRSLLAIESQLKEMARQRGVMSGQVGVMQKQLTEMKRSVDVVISKERARLSIRVLPFNTKPIIPFYGVLYQIGFSGITPAFVGVSTAVGWVSDVAEDDPPFFSPNMYDLPTSITPITEQINRTALILETIGPKELGDILDGKQFLHFRGFIEYQDAFKDVDPTMRETTAQMVWKVQMINALGMDIPRADRTGDWYKYGQPEDNRET